MVELARNFDGGLMKIADIADRQGIPPKYLAQIMNALKTAGYVRAVRGAEGGYRLARPPGEIFLAQILRLIDGPLAPVESVSKFFYAHTPIERSRKLLAVLKDIRDYTATKLEGTSLKDLV